jgi:hypothetical protein
MGSDHVITIGRFKSQIKNKIYLKSKQYIRCQFNDNACCHRLMNVCKRLEFSIFIIKMNKIIAKVNIMLTNINLIDFIINLIFFLNFYYFKISI